MRGVNNKTTSKEAKAKCDYLANQADNAEPSFEAKVAFRRKPCYMTMYQTGPVAAELMDEELAEETRTQN